MGLTREQRLERKELTIRQLDEVKSVRFINLSKQDQSDVIHLVLDRMNLSILEDGRLNVWLEVKKT